jgi:hypothetical protein
MPHAFYKNGEREERWLIPRCGDTLLLRKKEIVMTQERLTVNEIKEIMRLEKLSNRVIGHNFKWFSADIPHLVLSRYNAAGMDRFRAFDGGC